VNTLTHILRFAPRALRVIRRDVGSCLATTRHNVRAVWLVTDPDAIRNLLDQVESYVPTAQDEELCAQQEQRMRERHAAFQRDGRAVYEGELCARPVSRGLVLADLETRPDVETWLSETLGLDEWYGDSRLVRLIVEDADASSS
jgi:hypothetical protein